MRSLEAALAAPHRRGRRGPSWAMFPAHDTPGQSARAEALHKGASMFASLSWLAYPPLACAPAESAGGHPSSEVIVVAADRPRSNRSAHPLIPLDFYANELVHGAAGVHHAVGAHVDVPLAQYVAEAPVIWADGAALLCPVLEGAGGSVKGAKPTLPVLQKACRAVTEFLVGEQRNAH